MNRSSTSPSTVKLVLKARDRMVVGFTTKSTYFKFLLIAATCSAVHPNWCRLFTSTPLLINLQRKFKILLKISA